MLWQLLLLYLLRYDVSRSTKHIHVAASHETKTIFGGAGLLMLSCTVAQRGHLREKCFG